MVHVGIHEVIAFISKQLDRQREPQQIAGFSGTAANRWVPLAFCTFGGRLL